MNVAVFTDNDFDKVNGVTTTLTAVLTHAPADLGVRIYTAAPHQVDQPQYLALRSLGVPIPFYAEMRMYIPRVRAYLRHALADHIDLVHLTTPGPLGLVALRVALRLKVPIVGSFHTDLAAYTATLSGSPRLGALMREYMRWLYNRCDRVLVPSAHTRRMLVAARCHSHKIGVWRRGVDTELFHPAKRSRQLRDAWHVSERRPAILYVGRVSAEKGLGLLPAIQQRLHARGIQHRFIIVGQGAMMGTLQAAMWDTEFTGVLSRLAVAEAFASADLFVFPSRTDTAGNVVLEAQASGLPVVASSAGGPGEQMIAGRTGLLCETDDPEEWASAMTSIVRDPSRYRAMAGEARAYAVSRRWSETLQPLYAAYRDLGPVPQPDSPSPVRPPALSRV
jgi:glycosyltransferase involved in cell wall biosynthesis